MTDDFTIRKQAHKSCEKHGNHTFHEEVYCEGFYNGYKAGYHECEKEHEWHDLRKNPNDLPKEEKLGQTFVVAFAFNEQTQQYYSFDCAEYVDKGRFITHTIDGSNENNAYKIIAWKEIE